MFGAADALLCGSGSLAIEIALRACDVRAGNEVVLPTFCCTAVVPPILAVGATPVLADVADELNLTVKTVEAALTRKTKAVIVPHLFGNPAEIDRIVELARARNIRVIDDAAQALGATIEGRAVGSFGDAGIVSFGAEKVCFGLGGGVALSRHHPVAANFSQIDLAPATVTPVMGKLFSMILWRRLRSSLSKESVSPDAVPTAYRLESMNHLAAAVAASLLRTLDQNIAARRGRARIYREALKNCPGVELIAHQTGSACLSQVIRVEPRRRGEDGASRLIGTLAAEGYEVRGSYLPIHLLRSMNHCVWDRLPYAERVWADLVELPCEPSVSLDDVTKIA